MPEEPTPTPVAPPPPEQAKPDPLAESVARAIAQLRRDAGLSERAAAKKLGTSQTQLRRMEDPRYLPSLRSLQRVANAYGRTVRVSFGTTGADEPGPAEDEPRRAPAPAKRPERRTPPARRPARAATRAVKKTSRKTAKRRTR